MVEKWWDASLQSVSCEGPVPEWDARLLDTRLPDDRAVKGITYESWVSWFGGTGYIIHLGGDWWVASSTLDASELAGDGSDEAIIRALQDEISHKKESGMTES